MAIGDAYATPAEYKGQVGTLTSDSDIEVARELLAVSRLIDRTLGRPAGFNRDATAVARVYVAPRTSDILVVDDFVSLAVNDAEEEIYGVAIDVNRTGLYETILVTADYELLPRNAAVGPEARPYHAIALNGWRSRTQWGATQRVQVTAIWGWPAVPSGIKAATIELTAILRLESPRATNRINEMDQVLSTSRAAQNVLVSLMDTYAALPVFA